MEKMTRRDFLRLSVATLGVVAPALFYPGLTSAHLDKGEVPPTSKQEKSPFAEVPSVELEFSEMKTENLSDHVHIQNGRDDHWDESYNNTLGIPQESNVEVKDGNVFLWARKAKKPVDGFEYTAAMMHTEDTALEAENGKFVARIKIPSKNGVWPAFWLLSSSGKYISPTLDYDANEIDVMEHYFENRTVESTVHTNATVEAQQKDENAPAYATFEHEFTEKELLEFHDYGVELLPDSITFTIDGIVVGKVKRPENYDEKFYLIFDLEVGGDYAGINGIDLKEPVAMELENIKFYPYIG